MDRAGQRIDFASVTRKLASANYVLIGEVHTNPEHHAIQNRIVAVLARNGTFRALLFQMLESDHERPIASYMSDLLPISDLKDALQWSERGWPLWDEYARIFVSAHQARVRIAHASLERNIARHVDAFGFLALPRRMRQELGLRPETKLLVDPEALQAEIGKIRETDDEVLQKRLARSQYIKDAYMARQLSKFIGPSILIAGNIHVHSDLGVPAHLKSYRPNIKIANIALIEVADPLDLSGDEIQTMRKGYDFVWITSKPCERGRKR